MKADIYHAFVTLKYITGKQTVNHKVFNTVITGATLEEMKSYPNQYNKKVESLISRIERKTKDPEIVDIKLIKHLGKTNYDLK